MKKIAGIFLLLVLGCGGKLTQDERQRLHDGMSTQDIKRVTDADLEQAALNYAATVMSDVDKIGQTRKTSIDSLSAARGIRVYSLMPDKATLKEIEQKLIEAYIAGTDAGTAGDNLQRIGDDSLLFTRPVLVAQPDGSQRFSHAIAIRMSKRTVVLSMPKP